MRNQISGIRFQIFFIAVPLIFLAGCGEVIEKGQLLCECESKWEVPKNKAMPFYIKGDCIVDIDDDTHKIKESYSVKLFFEPDRSLYFQADHLTISRAMLMGSNANEFWFWIRHNEVSTYWFGAWDKVDVAGLIISPDIIFEAMGISNNGDAEYRVENGFYIVQQGGKRKYYSCCDGMLEKIEMVDGAGKVISVCNLSGYFWPIEGKDFVIASDIEIITFNKAGGENNISLKLKKDSFKEKEFSGKFRERYFSRPEPKGAKHIYKIGD